MKRAVIAVSMVVALVLASVALAAAVNLHGTYQTTIKSSVGGGVLNGTWTIKFKRPHYTVTENGTVELRGKYKIKGTTITFHDKTGRDVCPGPGKYKVNLTGTTLTFTLISDSNPNCVGRRTVLAGTFTKVVG